MIWHNKGGTNYTGSYLNKGEPNSHKAEVTCEGTEKTTWISEALARRNCNGFCPGNRRLVGAKINVIVGTPVPAMRGPSKDAWALATT